MKMLHLTVTRHWFDKIASGEKKEDFREIKQFWGTRLIDNSVDNRVLLYGDMLKEWMDVFSIGFKHFDLVKITAGYGKDKPTITAKCTGIRITADDEHTDLGVGSFFAIGVGDIIYRENF